MDVVIELVEDVPALLLPYLVELVVREVINLFSSNELFRV